MIEDVIFVTHAQVTNSAEVVVHHMFILPVLVIIIISLMLYSFSSVLQNMIYVYLLWKMWYSSDIWERR
jgi:hypothetical protein